MNRSLPLLCCLPTLIVLGGCSLFGVASTAELDDLAGQEAAATLATQQRLEAMEDRLAGISSDLRAIDPRLAEMEFGVEGLESDVDKARQRLQEIDVGLRGDVVKIQNEMDWIKQAADLASDHSSRALKVQYEALILERQRLGARVAVLDTLIVQWQRDLERIQAARPDSAAAAAGSDFLQIVPQSALPDSVTGGAVIDTLQVVPEQQKRANDEAS